jgi:hypothetical protein
MSRGKAIESPEKLWELFDKYKIWAKDNPYLWHDFVGKDAEEVWKKRERPITWMGFEAWLYREGVVYHLGHYEQNNQESYGDYLPVIRAIKLECSVDVIDGALAGVYNQNIAARLEGLADKKEVDKKITTLDFKDAE